VVADGAGFPRLLGDVGGTNARWAWQAAPGAALGPVQVLPCSDYPTIEACLRAFLSAHRLPAPRAVAFGIATAVTSDAVQMTNHPWRFSIEALRTSIGAERLVVLNDFEALAHAVPVLGADELVAIGRGQAAADANLAVIGPGTGLGVSGLVADGRGDWRVIVGEGGHVTLPAATPREASLLAVLRERFGHVSAERALSGPGLVNLYEAACILDGESAAALDPADVMARGLGDDAGGTGRPGAATDLQCAEAVTTFAGLLGNVAGNLALTLGARGGVFIGGGIVPRLGARFARLPFRDRFESKGRFRGYLETIPTWIIIADAPALLGAARALDHGT
jgi:glucokinase